MEERSHPGQTSRAGTTHAAASTFASAWRRAHLTVDQRVARGRAARQEVPRSSHGAWKASIGRPDPIALLEEQAQTRVPELVPIRYGRMVVSPFTFFRGAAMIMAADLASTPQSGITVQLCGDAHLSNFGLFGSPERRMLFDINDFDETLPGPWEWDVKRLAASFEVMGRDRGFSAQTAVRSSWPASVSTGSVCGRPPAWVPSTPGTSTWSLAMLKLVRKEVRVKRVSKDDARAHQQMWKKREHGTAPGFSPSERTRSTASCGSSRTRR